MADRIDSLLSSYGLEKANSRLISGTTVLENGCWDYKSKKDYGYSVFHFYLPEAKRTFKAQAHRISWRLNGKELISGLVLDHVCRNKYCINPSHLRQVTAAENTFAGIGPSAINKKKSECLRGHKFSKENTYNPPKMPHKRYCRSCMSLRAKELA